MSFRAVLWAFRQKLPPATKLVLAVIGSHANPKTGLCFPKIKTIADEASLNPRSIHRHNRILERGGFLEIEKKYRGKGRQPNNYRLNCPPDPKNVADVAGDTRPSDNSVIDKRNHNSNHNNKARQEAENALAGMLGPNGWEILATCSEQVPLLVGKHLRGTLQESDLLELRARFTMKGGQP
jgi:hypothetical protein